PARCVIWRYDEASATFDDAGTTIEDRKLLPHPRRNGWSSWIVNHRIPVCLDHIKDTHSFERHQWRGDTWAELPRTSETPATVHEGLKLLEVVAELGIPIEVHDRCLGVAWFLFESQDAFLLSPQTVHLAVRFAAQCGLVIDATRHRMEIEGQMAMAMAQEELSSKILTTG